MKTKRTRQASLILVYITLGLATAFFVNMRLALADSDTQGVENKEIPKFILQEEHPQRRFDGFLTSNTFQLYLPLVSNRWPSPLFVGLQLQWDGAGYVRGSNYYDIGFHQQNVLNGMTDTDTIRSHNYAWYSPNPLGLPSQTWDDYLSVSTGREKSSSLPPDPAWKWAYPWLIPYDVQFYNGQVVLVGNQAFIVSGPFAGYTAFGKSVQYWQLINRDKFLYWDGGGDWKQYVHVGDAILRYDSGFTRLLLYSNVLRRYYYKNNLTTDTVQYIMNLTQTNAFPNSVTNGILPAPPTSNPLSNEVNEIDKDGNIMSLLWGIAP
jgi:hypothetical protein